ncbi:MAG: hypothetical protein KKF27_20160 [Gammaproteobacteria bacterium]|nr:hypothetical protein [Gammaproteobacteria bacterium]
MPPNRRGYLVRRMEQANESVCRAERYLLEIVKTFGPNRFVEPEELEWIIKYLEFSRVMMRAWHFRVLGGRAKNMYKTDDLIHIWNQAKPVPDPHYVSQGDPLAEGYDESDNPSGS